MDVTRVGPTSTGTCPSSKLTRGRGQKQQQPPRNCPPSSPDLISVPRGTANQRARISCMHIPPADTEPTLPASSPMSVVRLLPTGQTQTWYILSLSLARMHSPSPTPGRKGKVLQVAARCPEGAHIAFDRVEASGGGGGDLGRTALPLPGLLPPCHLSPSPAAERKKETHALPWLISSKNTAREGTVISPGRGAASGYQRDAHTNALPPNTPQLTSCTPRKHSMTSASRPPLRSRRRSLPLPSASHYAHPKSGTRHRPMTAG